MELYYRSNENKGADQVNSPVFYKVYCNSLLAGTLFL